MKLRCVTCGAALPPEGEVHECSIPTLRDEFAVAYLNGRSFPFASVQEEEQFARDAYSIADTMLLVREE